MFNQKPSTEHFYADRATYLDTLSAVDRRVQDVPSSVLKEERRRPVNIINQEVLDQLCQVCFAAGCTGCCDENL